MAWTGDVKYHAGRVARSRAARRWTSSSRCRRTRATSRRSIRSCSGMARAAGTVVDKPGPPEFDPDVQLPILIHGDAAFPGQGVVAETLNLVAAARLHHRRHDPHHREQPDRVHDRPEDAYSTSTRAGWRAASRFRSSTSTPTIPRPASRRRGWRSPTARQFKRDFLIDLIGYRRYGHNEGDEPAFTQPLMYQKIAAHPTVREIWARTLVARGVIAAGRAGRAGRRRYMAQLQADDRRAEARAGLRRAAAGVAAAGRRHEGARPPCRSNGCAS